MNIFRRNEPDSSPGTENSIPSSEGFGHSLESDASTIPQSIAQQVDDYLRVLGPVFRDQSIMMEIRDLLHSGQFPIQAKGRLDQKNLKSSLDHLWSIEPTVLSEIQVNLLAFARPCLEIKNGTYEVPASEVVQSRLGQYPNAVRAGIERTGLIMHRVDSYRCKPIGTAWFIAPDIVVTTQRIGTMVFGDEPGGSAGAKSVHSYGWYELHPGTENSAPGSGWDRPIKLKRNLFPGSGEKGHFSLLQTETNIAFEGELTGTDTRNLEDSNVCAISFASLDHSNRVDERMGETLPDAFPKKCLCPGKIVRNGPQVFSHDCRTNGLSAGSMLMNLHSGKIAGMHLHGKLGSSHYAIPARLLEKGLQQIMRP